MKTATSFLAGTMFAVVFTATFAGIMYSQGVWVTKSEADYMAERSSTRMAVYLVLRREQEDFDGVRKANGCYIIDRPEIQNAVDRFALTSDELGQSLSELLCYGWILPADL